MQTSRPDVTARIGSMYLRNRRISSRIIRIYSESVVCGKHCFNDKDGEKSCWEVVESVTICTLAYHPKENLATFGLWTLNVFELEITQSRERFLFSGSLFVEVS